MQMHYAINPTLFTLVSWDSPTQHAACVECRVSCSGWSRPFMPNMGSGFYIDGIEHVPIGRKVSCDFVIAVMGFLLDRAIHDLVIYAKSFTHKLLTGHWESTSACVEQSQNASIILNNKIILNHVFAENAVWLWNNQELDPSWSILIHEFQLDCHAQCFWIRHIHSHDAWPWLW